MSQQVPQLLFDQHAKSFLLQDEMKTLARVATTHTNANVFALLDSPGWATLVTILSESGEHKSSSSILPRPPKRPSPAAGAATAAGINSGSAHRPSKMRNHSGEWPGAGDADDGVDALDPPTPSSLSAISPINAETNTLAKRVNGFRLAQD